MILRIVYLIVDQIQRRTSCTATNRNDRPGQRVWRDVDRPARELCKFFSFYAREELSSRGVPVQRRDAPRRCRTVRATLMPFALLLGLLIFLQPSAPASAAPPEISLALGSGGAGGLAHIAMLQVFDEMEVRPARISGTSIGAVIGALYAAGLSAEEIETIFRDFAGSKLDALTGILKSELALHDVFAVDLDDGGLIDPTAFLDFLAGHVEATRFEDLHIPLVVVATDFWSGESVIIDQGDLFVAVHASMAVPGLFDPVIRDDLLLVDGGTSKPLPFDLLLGNTDKVVAIDVSGNRRPHDDKTGVTDLLFKTFELMQQSLIREMRLRHEPDLYIKVDTNGVRLLELNRLDTILEQAQPAAEDLRQQLREWQNE